MVTNLRTLSIFLAVIATLCLMLHASGGRLQISEDDPGLKAAEDLVVMIDGKVGTNQTQGAGIIFAVHNDDAYIVTAFHVVKHSAADGDLTATNLKIRYHADPQKRVDAEFLVADESKEFAVIQAKVGSAKFRFARVGETQNLKRGLAVFAIGQPKGDAWGVTYTPGSISKILAERLEVQSAYVQPGHSGGALVDQQGRIIGLVNDTDGATAVSFRIDHTLEVLRRDLELPVDLRVVDEPAHRIQGEAVMAAGQVRLNAKDGQRYVWIPAGSYKMGCSPGDTECNDDDTPAHSVTITKGFWMGQTAVTSGAWKRYRKATNTAALPTEDNVGRKNWNEAGDDDMPAVMLTWDEAKSYCHLAGGMRLPTEAEWEYAARAGTTSAQYSELNSIAWYGDNSGNEKIDSLAVWNQANQDMTAYQKKLLENGNFVHSVGQKTPNAWKLFDILGNVYTWTADWYDPKYYDKSESEDPIGPPAGKERVVRGGSWYGNSRYVRASLRGRFEPAYRSDGLGCRCVGELP